MARPWRARLGVERSDAFGWAMYDWANSAVFTTIVAAVFPVYFAKVVSATPEGGRILSEAVAQSRFAKTTALALLTVALVSPLLGALCDLRPWKKTLLAVFTVIGGVACMGLGTVSWGDTTAALVLFFVINVAVGASVVLYDSLLPHVARGDEDRLSTTGFAFGYVGGGLLLALQLCWMQRPEWFGLPGADAVGPGARTLPARLALGSAGIWWVAFTLPLLRRVSEPLLPRATPPGTGVPVAAAFRRLLATLRELRRHRHAFLLLLAFLIYGDGIGTVIRMAGIYAANKDFGQGVIVGTLLLVQFVGVPFALLFGALARRFGAKPMIFVGLAVYVVVCLFGYVMETPAHFVLLGIMVGMVQGGCQALSRSLFARMIPASRSGEFFAFFSWGEKFAGLFGPLLFGLATDAFGGAQPAILSIVPFFLVGGALLWRVDVDAGIRDARAAERAYST